MKKYILSSLVLSVFFLLNLNAQEIIVKDYYSGKPLEFVTVSCVSGDKLVVTDIKGKADLSGFGCKELVISLLGYEKKTIDVEKLNAGKNEIFLKTSPITLDQVVVSAVKWQQPQRQIPMHLSIIPASEIAFQNPQTAADVVAESGEVFVQKSQQGGGSPMLRGFATNRVLISVDGIKMNTAIFRSGNVHNVISIDPYTIENTEIIFGPGSVVYGSDAIGGVMNFNTLSTQYSDNGRMFVKGSSSLRTSTANNEKTGHFDINLGWKKFAMLTSVSYNDYGDLRMGSKGPSEYLDTFYVQTVNNTDYMIRNSDSLVQKPTGYNQKNFMQKFSYKPHDKLELKYNFIYTESSDIPRYDRLIRVKNNLPRSAEWYYGPQVWMFNSLSLETKQSTAIYNSMIIRLAYQHFEESRIDRGFNKPTRSKRFEEVEAASVSVDFNKNFTEKNEIFYGFDAVYNYVKSTGIDQNIITLEENPAQSRYPQSDWTSIAVYGLYRHNFNEKLNVLSGIRYNHFLLNADFDTSFYSFPFVNAKLNDGAVTGTLGLNYSPTRNWIFAANVSTGFRSPNVDDMGKIFDSQPGYVMVPNPDLKAEYAYNGEGSITKIFGEFARIQLTGYYTFLDNALVRRDFSFNGQDSIIYQGEMAKVQAVQNAAFATVYGFQAGVEIKHSSGIGLHGRFNYQKGEEELDDGTTSPLRHAAPYFGTAAVFYSGEKFRLDLYSKFSGEVSYENMPQEEISKDYMYARDENGNPYSPAWYTLNMKAMYKFGDNFILTAGVENILDIRYRPYSSGIVAPGRNFIVGIKTVF